MSRGNLRRLAPFGMLGGAIAVGLLLAMCARQSPPDTRGTQAGRGADAAVGARGQAGASQRSLGALADAGVGVGSTYAGTAIPLTPQQLDAARYRFEPNDSGYVVHNAAHDLSARFDPGGRVTLASSTGHHPITFELASIGRGRRSTPVGDAEMHDGACSDESSVGSDGACPTPLEATRQHVVEQWTNDGAGLHHEMRLASPVSGVGMLRLDISIAGAVIAVDPDRHAATFARDGAESLRYAGLLAFDASGRRLDAWLDPSAAGLSVSVDDRNASYPIVIDPVVVAVAWTQDVNQVNAQFGTSVASAGDVNGDGYSDVIVGAPDHDNPEADEGRAYVYYGTASGAVSATAAWTAESNQAGAHFGAVVSSAGDVNGDGYADVAVAAPDWNGGVAGQGRVAVYLGSASGLSATPAWTGLGGQANAHFGAALAFGDVSNDGYSELVVGAPGYDDPEVDEGRVFLYTGSASGLSLSAAGGVEADQAGAAFGTAVALGDFTSSGSASLVVGAPSYDNGETDEGRAFRFDVSGAGVISASAGWTSESNQVSAHFGASLAAIGAARTSVRAMLAIGAPEYDSGETDEGRVSFFAATGADLDATPFRTEESNQASASYGAVVAFAGDLNGDGFGDWVIGAPGYDSGQTDEGRIYVYQGAASDAFLGPYTFESDQIGARLGASVASAGDVDGDGVSDLIVGAPLYDNGETDEGLARVYLGAPGTLTVTPRATVTPSAPSGGARAFGVAVKSAGDVNGDGFADVIVLENTDYDGHGSVYVYFGSAAGPATTASQIITPPAGGQFYETMSPVGDVNGDGYDDIAAGSPGGTYFFTGSASGLASTPATTLAASVEMLVGAGDVNGDGYDDVLLGNSGYMTGLGRAQLYVGSATGLVTTAAWDVTGTVASAYFGWAVLPAGDVNGDGFADVGVFSPYYSNGETSEGRLQVFYGSASGPSATANFTFESNCAGATLGDYGGTLGIGPMGGSGDLDGNGRADIVLGAGCGTGRLFVLRSGPTGLLDGFTVSTIDSASVGQVTDVGDFNGDGYADILASGNSGTPQIYFGSATGVGVVPTALSGIGGTDSRPDMLSRAGDTNGDGVDDIVTQAIGTPAGGYDWAEGASFYMGGDTVSDPAGLRRGATSLREPSVVTPLSPGGISTSSRGAQLRWTTPSSASGRTRSRIQIQGQTLSAMPGFSGALRSLGAFGASDVASITSAFEPVAAPVDNTSYTLRARLAYSPAGQVAVPSSRWRYLTPPGALALRTARCPAGSANSAAGSCDACQTDYYGPSCNYCLASTTCNAHGSCSAAGGGACSCSAGWAAPTCASCASGFVGSSCQYSDATTCSGHGAAQADGSCVCTTGFSGARCDACAANYWAYPTCTYCLASSTCTSHGSCSATGSCSCATGYSGPSCSACAAGYFGYPTCVACDPVATCMSRGTCTAGGACSCSAGYAGTNCQYSDAGTCNGRGTAQGDGSCVCTGFFAGATCSSCAAGHAGSMCQYSDATTCSGNGTAQADGSCVCAGGYTGAACAFSASATCNSHGTAQPDGSCVCGAGFSGPTCSVCATSFYGYPTCTFCQAATTCSGNGTCSAAGSCACSAGAAGPACQYTDAGTCRGHGVAQPSGSCVCATGFTGASCDACASGYAGYPGCAVCDRAGTCSNHGSCDVTGCVCDASYAGARCDTCAAGFVGYPTCAACDPAVTCRGRGTCAPGGGCSCDAGYSGSVCQYSDATSCRGHGAVGSGGACACDAGYTGASCEACATGYLGYPVCRSCTAATTCGGRGTCDASGLCACAAGYAGAGCEYSRAATCSSHGTPTATGGCTCDAGYAGATCAYDRARCSNHGNPQDSGSCLCDAGFSGAICELDSVSTCNGHGLVTSRGGCSCTTGYTGARCEACSTDHYGYPACNYCTTGMCNFMGSCGADGRCMCEPGRNGRYCELSDAESCNSHGSVQLDGTCRCEAYYAGDRCQYSASDTCSGVGLPRSDGTCGCNAGYLGPHCEYSDLSTCSGRGTASADGSCTCRIVFDGSHCERCAVDHYGATCDFCQADTTCNGYGTCSASGGSRCDCEAGRVGPSCAFTDATTCSGHGRVSYTGTCTCIDGWGGGHCETCAPTHYGADCSVVCDDATTCGGRGTCKSDGTCLCIEGTVPGSCDPCPTGSRCDGIRAPFVCPAGAYTPNNLLCYYCPEGQWAVAGSASCTACPDCNDFNPCTTDACDSHDGTCSHTANQGCTNCGNDLCEERFGETCSTCARDCGVCAVCGDGVCASDDTHDETCWNCAEDCSTCARPVPRPVADGGVPVDGGPLPGDVDGGFMCTGTPRAAGPQFPVNIEINRMRAQTMKLCGRQGRVEGFGNFMYGYAYDAEENMCTWDASAGLGLRTCVDSEQGSLTVSNCLEASLTASAECQREPRCDDSGFTCELGDVRTADCYGELGFDLSRTFEYAIRKDFGPFYAEASVGVGAGIRGAMRGYWGPNSGCPPASDATAQLTLHGSAHAGARIGITVAGHDYGLSGSVEACITVGVQARGCGRGIGLTSGFDITGTTPSLDLWVVTIGPFTRNWLGGDGCE